MLTDGVACDRWDKPMARSALFLISSCLTPSCPPHTAATATVPTVPTPFADSYERWHCTSTASTFSFLPRPSYTLNSVSIPLLHQSSPNPLFWGVVTEHLRIVLYIAPKDEETPGAGGWGGGRLQCRRYRFGERWHKMGKCECCIFTSFANSIKWANSFCVTSLHAVGRKATSLARIALSRRFGRPK